MFYEEGSLKKRRQVNPERKKALGGSGKKGGEKVSGKRRSQMFV